MMKVSMYIFTGILFLVLGMLHVQPLFLNDEVQKEQTCAKSKCQKQKPYQQKKDASNEKKGCTNEGCNPFVPCSIGSCCYLIENFFSNTAFSIIKKQKLALHHDKALLKRISECWHPPEII